MTAMEELAALARLTPDADYLVVTPSLVERYGAEIVQNVRYCTSDAVTLRVPTIEQVTGPDGQPMTVRVMPLLYRRARLVVPA